MTIANLNKQGKLYSQDYRPVWWSASQADWQPLRLKVTYRREGEDFQLRFCHRFENAEETLFAFAVPFSYQQTQDMLDRLDQQLLDFTTIPSSPAGPEPRDAAAEAAHTAPGELPGSRGSHSGPASSSGRPSPAAQHSPESARIYYRRQLLAYSLEGRRVDLLTITDCSGSNGRGDTEGVFEHDPGPPAAAFHGKQIFFVTSRVHPGETPATHMFNGMLAFLLRRHDPRAAALRRRFVFKLVPLVNPDGVAAGNYRTDTLGQNLNRFYTAPDKDIQPSVYAIKALLMGYARQGLLHYYLDLHAHANKKGVFIYGNTLEDGEAHLQSLLYAKLVALNNSAFDFTGCNYTEKNMSRADKDGASKEGAGRVALYRETALPHLYTIEANYNMARVLGVVSPASGEHGGRASPPCNKRFPPRFTTSILQGVGRAVLVAALDMEGLNPWSRLPNCEYRSLEGVRAWLLSVLRASPETRAAHLPPISDQVVECLRGKVASGALRLSSSLARNRSLPCDAPSGSTVRHSSSFGGGSGAIAFGRSAQVGTTASGARRVAPPPAGGRISASLPVVAGGGGQRPPLAPSSGRASLSGSGLPLSAPLPRRPSSSRTATNNGEDPSDSDGTSGNEAEGASPRCSGNSGSARFRGLRASAEPPIVIARRQMVTLNGVGSVSSATGLTQYPQQSAGMRGCARPLSASAGFVRSQSGSSGVAAQGAASAVGAGGKSRGVSTATGTLKAGRNG